MEERIAVWEMRQIRGWSRVVSGVMSTRAILISSTERSDWKRERTIHEGTTEGGVEGGVECERVWERDERRDGVRVRLTMPIWDWRDMRRGRREERKMGGGDEREGRTH